MFTRYAIYDTPAPGTPLAEFGAAWLGWDSAVGAGVAHPDVGLDVEAVTRTPRKYGFHGTLKPPFRLADGCTPQALEQAIAQLCADLPSVEIEALRLARLGRFLALVPEGDTAALGAFAARIVQDLDRFRAPPTEAELARRRAAHLTPAQEAHLRDWGYPFVLDAFRFHMTLSGQVDPETAASTQAALAPLLSTIAMAPYKIKDITLLGEDADGMFHQIRRFSLGG